MADLVVYPAERPLVGSVPVPGDKSIAHRAILLAGLATGRSRVDRRRARRGQPRHARRAPRDGRRGRRSRPAGALVIEGVGLHGLRARRQGRSTAATPARRCACSRACSSRSASPRVLVGRRLALAAADGARRQAAPPARRVASRADRSRSASAKSPRRSRSAPLPDAARARPRSSTRRPSRARR